MEAQAVRFRRWRALLLSLGLALGGFGCGDSDSGPLEPAPGSDDQPGAQGVTFADSSLEMAVRVALGQPGRPLTADSLLTLTRLSASGRGIVDLHGIEQLQRLTALDLAENRIIDLTPLAGLPRLEFLDLTSNQVQDLSPLAGLGSLRFLALAYNPIHDLTPLLRLSQLQWLEILGVPLNQEAEQRQLPVLRQRGVEIALSPGATEDAQGARPDNQSRIAFISNRDGNLGLYTVRPDGSDLRRWNDQYGWWAQRISPRQDRIVFVRSDTARVRADLYIADLDGSNPRNVTRSLAGRLAELTSWYLFPFWSPEGERLGARAGNGPYGGRLLLVDLKENTLSHFFANEELNKNFYLSLSPQWDRVAYLSGEGAKLGTYALYVSDLEGSSPRLVQDAVVDIRNSSMDPYQLVWSPDGGRLAFVSNRDGNQELYVINLDGSRLKRLTYDDAVDTYPAWSPDSRWLAFDSSREGRWWEVFVVDVEGMTTYNLTNSVFTDERVCGWLDGE